MKRALGAACALLALACAGRGGAERVPRGSGPIVGLYRATIGDGSGGARRARLLLWAVAPDRLHAELLSPVGGVRFVLDAGKGAACLMDVAEGVAYCGDGGPDAIGAFAGVLVSVGDAVAALLVGTAPAGIEVTREGEGGRLPSTLHVQEGPRSLHLERIRYDRGAGPADGLGTGAPPPGVEVRPLAAWRGESAAVPEAPR